MTNKVFVFDLDDTLYKERDYQISGFKYLTFLLNNFFPENKGKVSIQDLLNEEDPLECLRKVYNLNINTKESLLWTYRTHRPNIKLSKEVKSILDELIKKELPTYILTDGREITQKLKIDSLGLNHIPCLTSESHNEIKPAKKRFQIISNKHPSALKYYVGDNLEKDFRAPNQMEWTTIGLIPDNDNIHKPESANLHEQDFPDHWIDSFLELKDFL